MFPSKSTRSQATRTRSPRGNKPPRSQRWARRSDQSPFSSRSLLVSCLLFLVHSRLVLAWLSLLLSHFLVAASTILQSPAMATMMARMAISAAVSTSCSPSAAATSRSVSVAAAPAQEQRLVSAFLPITQSLRNLGFAHRANASLRRGLSKQAGRVEASMNGSAPLAGLPIDLRGGAFELSFAYSCIGALVVSLIDWQCSRFLTHGEWSAGKRAFIAGVADDQGFGWAIAKALSAAGAEILVGTWVPVCALTHQPRLFPPS